MEHKRHEIRIGGSGGQGIITTGILLGETATLYDHQFAVQTQSYGPEARGGASKTDVVISPNPIDYPKVITPTLIAVLSREAFVQYSADAGPETIILADSDSVDPSLPQTQRTLAAPICDVALRELGNALTTNIILLGFIIGISGVVSVQAAELAVATRFATKKPELNLKALRRGLEMASEMQTRTGGPHVVV